MSTHLPRRHTTRLAILTTAIIGSFALLWLWFGRPHAAPEPPPAATQPAGSEKTAPPARVVAAAATPPAPPGAEPIVDEVIVEKPRVCEGEANLVTVRAHTPDGTDPFLHYTIAGTAGSPNPVRLYRGKDGGVAWPSVRVFGRNNVSTTVPVPKYEVVDCGPSRTVLIGHTLMPNTSSSFEFAARIAEHGDLRNRPFHPAEYRWRFGDGANDATTAGHVTHSYEARSQDTLSSDFVVEVEVRSTEGERVSGRAVIDMRNPAFEMLSVGHVVALMTSLNPRFPSLDADGVVSQGVRLWHHRPGPVTITRVRATTSYADGHTSSPRDVDVVGLLGTSRIAPGPGGVQLTARFDTTADPDALVVSYDVEGRSSDGLAVKGGFSVMRPPVPSKTPITDTALLEKVAAAQQILHTDTITTMDLRRLEREGAFASIAGAKSKGSR